MRQYQFSAFGLDELKLADVPEPTPGPGEVVVRIEAFSLNYRDLLVVRGAYNPNISLPATPVSDAAGTVSAIGEGVRRVAPGDRVVTHFVADWTDGPFEKAHLASTLGVPGPGVAAEKVLLPERAVIPLPEGIDSVAAATLPIAALTAWSVLVTEGSVQNGQWVLTLGTGGVSIFALQLGKSLGARVAITSSSDEKLERARALGADACINYRTNPRWDKEVLAVTDGLGAHIVVESGGIETMTSSLRATRAGGLVGVLGGVTGLVGEINIGFLTMKRLRVHGVLVDSRRRFEEMLAFLSENPIEPIVDRVFPFEELPAAMRHLETGAHLGKLVVTA